MDIFAVTTRGLENLCAEEMAEIPLLIVKAIRYRRVEAEYGGPLMALLKLKVVDDIFLQLATWTGVLRQRDSLGRMEEQSARLMLNEAAALLEPLQRIPAHPTFSVTANFVGKRNYSTDEIKLAVAKGITSRLPWTYQENDQPNALNLRIFIEEEQATVGLRLSPYPLHQRPYKLSHVSGSTKPSVAAGLIRLAQVGAGAVILDPCCGAGTILIEGALPQVQGIGGDIDPGALDACKANLTLAHSSGLIQRWDARRLPLASQSVDRIISNLPWGRQVMVDIDLKTFYEALCAEMIRVLKPGGKIVLLANEPQFVDLPALKQQAHLEISLFGQNPKILVYG